MRGTVETDPMKAVHDPWDLVFNPRLILKTFP